jgi:DNA-directed RNA polymerase specialized sigma24 family protein
VAQSKSHQAPHLHQLQELLALPKSELHAALVIKNHRDAGFVANEVLAILVRAPTTAKGLRELAAGALTRRIISLVVALIKVDELWRTLLARQGVLEETVQTVWQKLLADAGPVASCEIYFGLFAQSRAKDYLSSLMAKKRSAPSYDNLDAEGDDSDPALQRIADDAPGPDEEAMRELLRDRLFDAYVNLPKLQRDAVYYRLEQERGWKEVAAFLKCSEPTATKHYRSGIDTLLRIYHDAS